MTREEAIAELSVIWERLSHPEDCENGCYSFRDGDYLEALDMAIEALQNLSKPNNGLQGSDLISRQDALKPFCIAPDGTRIPEVDCDNFPVEFSAEFIKKHLLSLPSADRPKTGHWVEIEDYNGDIHYQCDQCGEEFILIDGTPEDNNYWHCPNCGSYNREVRKNED